VRLSALNALDRQQFVNAVGAIFEHSPWIAERAHAAAPFADPAALHGAMMAVVDRAGESEKLALLRAHPDLAGKLARAGALTAHSTGEQASAGLDRLNEDEYRRFTTLNDAYKARFGFPFIIAVRENTKASILAAFERRLEHDRNQEFATALTEVGKIARMRLSALIEE
jgi:2-oxo-4-hydroxy-4-carboxy-5-ureidoimidazoline decarboxylase